MRSYSAEILHRVFLILDERMEMETVISCCVCTHILARIVDSTSHTTGYTMGTKVFEPAFLTPAAMRTIDDTKVDTENSQQKSRQTEVVPFQMA
jgi:hypothetical protein